VSLDTSQYLVFRAQALARALLGRVCTLKAA
jgi:hypothetical protein